MQNLFYMARYMARRLISKIICFFRGHLPINGPSFFWHYNYILPTYPQSQYKDQFNYWQCYRCRKWCDVRQTVKYHYRLHMRLRHNDVKLRCKIVKSLSQLAKHKSI